MRSGFRHLWALAVPLFLLGCTPKIGDKCNQSTDCSQLGDRLCDGTQPAGYCTIFNCEPGGCPTEAVCIAFNYTLDPACGHADDARWPRFERTFCMKGCSSDGDCRDGYACIAPADRSAAAVDNAPTHDRVCMAIASTSGGAGGGSGGTPAVCYPTDGGPPLTPYDGGSAASGGGKGGAGGAAGGGGGKGGAGGH